MSRSEFGVFGETVFEANNPEGQTPFLCNLRRPTVIPNSKLISVTQETSQSSSDPLVSLLPIPRRPSSSSLLNSSQNSTTSSSRRSSSAVADEMEGLVVQNPDGGEDIIFLDSDDEEGPAILEEAHPIGKGAEGTVYKAKAYVRGDEEAVAIKKTPFKTKPSNGSAIHQKLTEQDLSSCDHNILRLLKINIKDHVAFLTLPFCDVFLDQAMMRIKRESIKYDNRMIQWAMIAQVGSDILEALRYMHTFPHENGIGYVHRDVKLANIALKYSNGGWHAVLCDLETAEEMGKANVTQAGTLPFMHPFCFIKSGKDVTAENDLYQLGVTLLMLLGKSQSVLPPETLTSQIDVMQWKENKYHLESAAYENAKKTAESTRIQDKATAFIRMRMLSGLTHTTLSRKPCLTIYPTLKQDLENCSSIKDKLTVIGMHLTRCFEQPTIQEVEAALTEIRIQLIQNYPGGKEVLHQELESFYENLKTKGDGTKSLKHTTSSFFRDYGNRRTTPQPSRPNTAVNGEGFVRRGYPKPK